MSDSLTGIFWELTMQGGCCKELKMWIWSKFSSILMRIRECSWPPQVILLPLLSLYYYLLPTMIPSHVEYKQSKTSHTIFKVSNILRLWQITLQNGKCIWALSGMQILLRPISVADIYILVFEGIPKKDWQIDKSADYTLGAYYPNRCRQDSIFSWVSLQIQPSFFPFPRTTKSIFKD